MATEKGKTGSFRRNTTNYSSNSVYVKVSWSESYDVQANTSTISASLSIGRDDTGYTTQGDTHITIYIDGTGYTYPVKNVTLGNNNSISLGTVTSHTIKHSSDGTKTINMFVNGYLGVSNGDTSVTGFDKTNEKVELTKLLAASTFRLNRQNVPADGTTTVNVLDIKPAKSTYSHVLNVWCGSYKVDYQIDAGKTSYSFTIPVHVAQQFPNSSTGSCTVSLTAYDGSNKMGTSSVGINITLPSNGVPSVSSLTASVAETKLAGYYVRGKSKVKLTASATGYQGSTIKSWYWSVTDAGSGTTANSWTSGYLNQSGSISCNLTVKDSRGMSASSTVKINVVDYKTPTIVSNQIYRCLDDGSANDEGTKYRAIASVNWTPINQDNKLYFYTRSVLKGSSDWTSKVVVTDSMYATPASEDIISTDTIENEKEYYVELGVYDSVIGEDNAVTIRIYIPTSKVMIIADDDRVGLLVYPKGPGSWTLARDNTTASRILTEADNLPIGVRAIGGSGVWSGSGGDYVQMFSIDSLASDMGITDKSSTHYAVMVSNGASSDQPVHVIGSAYNNSNKYWYAVLGSKLGTGTLVRINWVAFHYDKDYGKA